MKRILITGGSGFLGVTLAEYLKQYRTETKKEFEIRTVDLEPSPVKGVEHRQGSILDASELSEATRGCDTVVHLAALLGVENTEKRRLACLNINIQGTIAVMDACAREGVQKVIFASSSEVYGDQKTMPISEENPVHPKSIYAVTKLAGEEYVRTYGERYGMKHVIFRFFNAYGAWQVGQFVVSRFIQAALNNESPMLSGDGSQVRAFCYGTDIADGVTRALFSDRADGHTLNIGNDREPVTMRELAERVLRIAGKTDLRPKTASVSQLDRAPNRDIAKRIPNLEKVRKLLDFEAKVSLDEGIRKVMESGVIKASWTNRVSNA